MKTCLLAYLLLLLTSFAFGQGQPGAIKGIDPFAQLLPIIKEERLPYVDTSKKIKSIIQRSYLPVMRGGKLQKGSAIEEVYYEYDEHGSLARRELRKIANASAGEHAILPRTFTAEPVVVNKCEYDAKGNLIFIPHLPGVYDASQRFEYNDHGQVVVLRQYFPPDTLQWTQNSKYNEQHLLTEVADRNSAGQITSKQYFRYDAQGNKIEMFTVDERNNIPTHWKLTYDSTHKVTEVLITGYDANPKKQTYKYFYDARGRKDKIYITVGDSTRIYSAYEYDAQGPGYHYSEFNTAGTITQTAGNHTRKRESFDNNTHRATTREWQYDLHNNIIYFLETRTPAPGESILPQMVLETDEIKYR